MTTQRKANDNKFDKKQPPIQQTTTTPTQAVESTLALVDNRQATIQAQALQLSNVKI